MVGYLDNFVADNVVKRKIDLSDAVNVNKSPHDGKHQRHQWQYSLDLEPHTR